MSSNDNDGWTVVTSNDKKRVMRQKGGRRRTPSLSTRNSVQDSSHLRPDRLMECLEDAKDYLKSHTTLWREVSSIIDQIICSEDETPVKEIVCLGLGNFATTKESYLNAPLFQLALALCLQQRFPAASIVGYDPCWSSEEKEFLKDSLGWAVPNENCSGAYRATGDTIFFLPHCPRGLYETLIRSNWETCHTLVFIGNSLVCLGDRNHKLAIHQLVVADLLEEFGTLHLPSKECDRSPGNLFGAFNDTFVACIHAGEVKWPNLGLSDTFGNIDPEVIR